MRCDRSEMDNRKLDVRKANSCLTDGDPARCFGSVRPGSLTRSLADLPDDLDPSTSSKRRRDAKWMRTCVTNSLTDAPHRSACGWQRLWRLLNDDDDDDDDDDNDDDDGCNCGTALRIRGTEQSAECEVPLTGTYNARQWWRWWQERSGAARMCAAISTMFARQSCRVNVGAATAVETILH